MPVNGEYYIALSKSGILYGIAYVAPALSYCMK